MFRIRPTFFYLLRRLAIYAAVVMLLLLGCEDADSTGDTMASQSAGEFGSEKVDGIWVFKYRPRSKDNLDALWGGPVELKGSCLVVGGAVVVWHSDHMEWVRDLIAAVQAGGEMSVTLGGGDGATTVSPVILEHCPDTKSLWVENPEPFRRIEP